MGYFSYNDAPESKKGLYFNYESNPRSLKIITPVKAGFYVYTLLMKSGSQVQVSLIKCRNEGARQVQVYQPELQYE